MQEEEGGGIVALRVPSSLRLLSVTERRSHPNTHLAADLPSGDEEEDAAVATSPHTAARGGDGGEALEATMPGTAGAQLRGRAAHEDDDYYDDDFEAETDDEDDGSCFSSGAALEATLPSGPGGADLRLSAQYDAPLYGVASGTGDGGALAATLPSLEGPFRAPSGFGSFAAGGAAGGASRIDGLEATLRQLQLRNDEQAVVQDEVEALSGTLRAVAESVVRDTLSPSARPEANIQIHWQFSMPVTDGDFSDTHDTPTSEINEPRNNTVAFFNSVPKTASLN